MDKLKSLTKPTYIVFFLTIYAYAASMLYEVAYLRQFDIGFEVIQITPPIIARAIAYVLAIVLILAVTATTFFVYGVCMTFLYRILKALRIIKLPALKMIVNYTLPVLPLISVLSFSAGIFGSFGAVTGQTVASFSSVIVATGAALASILQLKNIGRVGEDIKRKTNELTNIRAVFPENVFLSVHDSSTAISDDFSNKVRVPGKNLELKNEGIVIARDMIITLKSVAAASIPYIVCIIGLIVALGIPYSMGNISGTNYRKHPQYVVINNTKQILVRIYGENLVVVDQDKKGNVVTGSYYIKNIDSGVKIYNSHKFFNK